MDQLHEEMIAAKKALSEEKEEETSDAGEGRGSKEAGPENGSTTDEGETGGESKGDEEWEQVGPKNKSTITRQVSGRGG